MTTNRSAAPGARLLGASAAVMFLSLTLVWGANAQEGEDGNVDASREFSKANRLASAGAITRSIPHYEKVLKAAPDEYPKAFYNLAEVYRFKDECQKALILYQAYLVHEQQEGDRTDAKSGIDQCTAGRETGVLKVSASPEDQASVTIDEYLIGGIADVDQIDLSPGEYTVEVTASEHKPRSERVEIEAGQTDELDFELEKKLFYGEVFVDVDQKGAQIKLEPKELDSPRAEEKTRTFESPMEEATELPTGKYFLEVTRSDYDRWIRNIEVERESKTTVDVQMVRSLPEAIRQR